MQHADNKDQAGPMSMQHALSASLSLPTCCHPCGDGSNEEGKSLALSLAFPVLVFWPQSILPKADRDAQGIGRALLAEIDVMLIDLSWPTQEDANSNLGTSKVTRRFGHSGSHLDSRCDASV